MMAPTSIHAGLPTTHGAHDHDIPADSKARQRHALLAALREYGALNTVDIREYLNIMHVAGRVHELRRLGYDIITTMAWAPDSDGRLHRQATYSLRVEVDHGA